MFMTTCKHYYKSQVEQYFSIKRKIFKEIEKLQSLIIGTDIVRGTI